MLAEIKEEKRKKKCQTTIRKTQRVPENGCSEIGRRFRKRTSITTSDFC